MASQATVASQQVLEAQVAGPDGATRLLTVTGLATCNLAVSAPSPGGGNAAQQGTFAAYVGPALTRAQFRKAVATVSLAALSATGNLTAHAWTITAIDADFDEDEGQVQLEFDVRVDVQGPPMAANTQLLLASVSFQVTILAA